MTTAPAEPILCRVHSRPAPGGASLDALTKVIAAQPRPAILGANTSVPRYSIFSAEPVEILELKEEENPFARLRAFLEKYKLEKISPSVSGGLPLPGWMGFFSYPLARHIEKLPQLATDDLHLPLIYLAFYDKTIVCDHTSKQYVLLVLDYAGQRQTVDEKFRRLQSWLDEAAAHTRPEDDMSARIPNQKKRANTQVRPYGFPDDDSAVGADLCVCPDNNSSIAGPTGRSLLQDNGIVPAGRFTANMTREEYFDAIQKIKRHILDGDVYQINFSRRWMCDFAAEPVDCFLWQNQYNPSPLSAYLSCDDWAIVSASPELFLQTEADTILTRPIKGTRPRKNRADLADFNQRQYEELLTSEKEQAELMMIVDLERNDLARVCVPGTRHVRRRRSIDTHPTLFHASADIAGFLPRRNDPALFCDILRAVFPGGSITGAPKIRAMEIIEELEPTARGLYTGCIGHIGIDFNTTLNIAIRTIIIRDKKAYVQTGGGIVDDSDPDAEWREMLLKADALLMSLNAIH
jgi:para-aminobenzoate synthetase component 1